jgi:hypothetical protein
MEFTRPWPGIKPQDRPASIFVSVTRTPARQAPILNAAPNDSLIVKGTLVEVFDVSMKIGKAAYTADARSSRRNTDRRYGVPDCVARRPSATLIPSFQSRSPFL